MKNKIINKILCFSSMLLLTSICNITIDKSEFNGLYSSSLKRLANENNVDAQEESSVFTETKGMKSNDGKYMLIATGIKLSLEELSNYKAVGYELTINDEKQDDRSSSYYYTAISVNTGNEENPTFTYKIENIFNEENVLAMIVDEIDYSKENTYGIKAFLLDNEDNKIYAEEKQKAASYTLSLADGYKFVDGSVAKELAEASTLPEINNETGKEIAGWYTKDEKYIWNIDSFVMPKENITIYPFFAPENGTSLVPCSGKTSGNTFITDYFDKFNASDEEKASSEYKSKYQSSNIEYKQTIVDSIKGAELSSKVTLNDQDYFRMLTSVGANGVLANNNYRFNFKFENRGTETITFEAIQVQSGVKIDALDGAVTTGNITLQPNEIKDVSIEINLTNANKNIMTVIAMHSEVNNLKLGVTIAKEDNITIKNKYALNLANSNVTFKDGTSSIKLAQGEKMPEIINNVTDRTIVGWASDTKTFSVDEFKMIASDITLKPIFSAKDGFTSLVPGSEQGTGKPANLKNLSLENFNNASKLSTIVDGGENGCSEKGYILTYNGNMAKDSAFRLNTVVSSSAVVTLHKNHQFAYNFENKGTADIHFRMYQINSDTDISDNIYVDIDLKPGESMSTILTANFTKGSANKNALSYFVVTQQMEESMKLGISMSVKLDN